MQYEAERYQEILRDLMVKMWTAAEIRYEEFQSMDGMTDILANHGYQVEKGVFGLPTAYRAVYGQGKPVIGLLAEYDALDGLSQKADVAEYALGRILRTATAVDITCWGLVLWGRHCC